MPYYKTLRDALHTWLFRTPIQGSIPSENTDNDAVDRFIEEYTEAQSHHNSQRDRLIASGVGNAEEITKICSSKPAAGIISLLWISKMKIVDVLFDDISALTFIESYRELFLT